MEALARVNRTQLILDRIERTSWVLLLYILEVLILDRIESLSCISSSSPEDESVDLG